MKKELMEIAAGLTKAFPDGNDPFQIMTRLTEECGELAREVNHWERTGVKVQKHGEPSKKNLAKEIQNVLTSALQIAIYYQVEDELEESINQSVRNMISEGLIPTDRSREEEV